MEKKFLKKILTFNIIFFLTFTFSMKASGAFFAWTSQFGLESDGANEVLSQEETPKEKSKEESKEESPFCFGQRDLKSPLELVLGQAESCKENPTLSEQACIELQQELCCHGRLREDFQFLEDKTLQASQDTSRNSGARISPLSFEDSLVKEDDLF